jgi:hypothetical protein
VGSGNSFLLFVRSSFRPLCRTTAFFRKKQTVPEFFFGHTLLSKSILFCFLYRVVVMFSHGNLSLSLGEQRDAALHARFLLPSLMYVLLRFRFLRADFCLADYKVFLTKCCRSPPPLNQSSANRDTLLRCQVSKSRIMQASALSPASAISLFLDELTSRCVPISAMSQVSNVPTLRASIVEPSRTTASSCAACAASFSDFMEQRAHFKSDWHRYSRFCGMVVR